MLKQAGFTTNVEHSRCLHQLFVTVTKVPGNNNSEKEKFILNLRVQRFSRWLVSSISGPEVKENIMAEG